MVGMVDQVLSESVLVALIGAMAVVAAATIPMMIGQRRNGKKLDEVNNAVNHRKEGEMSLVMLVHDIHDRVMDEESGLKAVSDKADEAKQEACAAREEVQAVRNLVTEVAERRG